jgi:hypothetical protein
MIVKNDHYHFLNEKDSNRNNIKRLVFTLNRYSKQKAPAFTPGLQIKKRAKTTTNYSLTNLPCLIMPFEVTIR